MGTFRYLVNVINSVLENEEFLLGDFECDTMRTYLSRSDYVKDIVFKLLNYRKNKYNRLSSFQGLNTSNHAYEDLQASGLCSFLGPSEPMSWLLLLKLEELRHLAKERKINSRFSKAQYLREHIYSNALKQKTLNFLSKDNNNIEHLISECKNITGHVVNLLENVCNAFEEVFVIYYKQRYWPDSGKFMLDTIFQNGINPITFADYKIWKKSVWTSRESFLRYFNCLKLEHNARVKLNNNNQKDFMECVLISKQLSLKDQNPTKEVSYPWLVVYTEEYVVLRLLYTASKALFKLKKYQEQEEILLYLISQNQIPSSKIGDWYEDLAKIRDLYIDKHKSIETCLQALRNPRISGKNLLSIKNRLQKLKPNAMEYPKRNIPSETLFFHKVHSRAHQKSLWLSNSNEIVTVEVAVLENYTQKEKWKGFHRETTLFTTLFGLIFWDVIFDDNVPAVFLSPTQSSPLDLKTQYFCPNRSRNIEARLKELRNGGTLDILKTVYEEQSKNKVICRGVFWDIFELEDILEIAQCLGAEKISRICDAFCRSYNIYKSGSPDICLWKPDGSILFIEVKGENDTVSQAQNMWFDLLNELDIPVKIVHVKSLKRPRLNPPSPTKAESEVDNK